MKALLLLIPLLAITGCTKKNEFDITGVVTKVGGCGGGESFTSGNLECGVEIKRPNGSFSYASVLGVVAEGQPVYTTCWEESDGKASCFSTWRKGNPRR